jgi:hypothetical protein
MKNTISAVIAVFICFMLSKSCITDYTHRHDNDGTLKTYEKMISENSYVTGTLDSFYNERIYKSKKTGSVKRTEYDFTYHYSVAGNTYTGKHTFEDIRPTRTEIKVYYLSDDPSFSRLYPQELLNSGKEKSESKSDLYWGIGFAIIGVLVIFGFVSEVKEKAKARAEERARNFMG